MERVDTDEIIVDETDHEESDRCEDSIDGGYERLCLEYHTKTITEFLGNGCILEIQKCKIPISDLLEKEEYRFSLHDEYIREDESDKKFCQDDACISQVSYGLLSDRFEISRIKYIRAHTIESDIYAGRMLDGIDESLDLARDTWSSEYELSHLMHDLWCDVYHHKSDHRQK